MKKVDKLSHGVWSNVSGNKDIFEESNNGKKTGRIAELINLKVSSRNKMEIYNEYIKNHKNIIVVYDSQSFEPFLYKVKN